jgi:hypothetical protein
LRNRVEVVGWLFDDDDAGADDVAGKEVLEWG